MAEWSGHLQRLLVHRHLGVSLSVANLLAVLLRDGAAPYAQCYLAAVEQLDTIVTKEDYKDIYLYYDIPVPWLQVKLLQLLQLYPPTHDKAVLATLYGVIDHIMRMARTMSDVCVQQSNAYNATLFEAVRLALHLDAGSAVVQRGLALLGRFIHSPETNVRLLALDAMARMAPRLSSTAPFAAHQDTILAALHDRDTSVQRRALDLVTTMCDEGNGRAVVAYLLTYLPTAAPALRETLVTKIAALAEQYAHADGWYIDTITTLLRTMPASVSEAIWPRIVHVVTSWPTPPTYALTQLVALLERGSCHEAGVKASVYLLGELGGLVADRPGAEPHQQLQLVQARVRGCKAGTRAMALTAYFKWVPMYPALRPQLVALLAAHQSDQDRELQQRAWEYLGIVELGDEDLLAKVCEEVPLPQRPPPGASERGRKATTASYGRGVPRALSQAGPSRSIPPVGRLATDVDLLNLHEEIAVPPLSESIHADDWGSAALHDTPTLLDSEAQREMQGLLYPAPPLVSSDGVDAPRRSSDAGTAEGGSSRSDVVSLALPLQLAAQGVLLDEDDVQLRFQRAPTQLSIVVANRGTRAVHVTLSLSPAPGADADHIHAELEATPTMELAPGAAHHATVHVKCAAYFAVPPRMHITLDAPHDRTVCVPLPLTFAHFLHPVAMSLTAFFQRWNALPAQAPLEAQRVVRWTSTEDAACTLFHSAYLHVLRPDAANIVSAGVFQSVRGAIGVLARFEPNRAAGVGRLTVRTTEAVMTTALAELLAALLEE